MAESDNFFTTLFKNHILKLVIILLGITFLFNAFYFTYKAYKGVHVKFFGIEYNMEIKHDTIRLNNIIYKDTCESKIIYQKTGNKEKSTQPIINGKNVNTGINNGNIGDVINNNPVRHLDSENALHILYLVDSIRDKFKIEGDEVRIQRYIGSDNSTIFINELSNYLKNEHYLVTFGSPCVSTSGVIPIGLVVKANGDHVSIYVGTLYNN